jgi:hypothetical protein
MLIALEEEAAAMNAVLEEGLSWSTAEEQLQVVCPSSVARVCVCVCPY